MAGQLLISEGHEVVLHGRNQARAAEALASAPGAAAAVTGDLSRIAEIRSVADQVNRHGCLFGGFARSRRRVRFEKPAPQRKRM